MLVAANQPGSEHLHSSERFLQVAGVGGRCDVLRHLQGSGYVDPGAQGGEEHEHPTDGDQQEGCSCAPLAGHQVADHDRGEHEYRGEHPGAERHPERGDAGGGHERERRGAERSASQPARVQGDERAECEDHR